MRAYIYIYIYIREAISIELKRIAFGFEARQTVGLISTYDRRCIFSSRQEIVKRKRGNKEQHHHRREIFSSCF